MTNYEELSKEELIELIKQRDNEIAKLKSGYIYMIQFENDKQNNIYKLGKTNIDTIENRFAQYRNNETNKRGKLNHIRCGRVKDALKAEQMLHTLIRMQIKSTNDGNEWYQTDDEYYLNVCFDKTLAEYGLNVDDIVKKYDQEERALLEDRLEPITRYTMKRNRVVEFPNDTYFIDIDNKTIYKRTTNDTISKVSIKKDVFTMKGADGKSKAISFERLIEQYNHQ